MARHSSVCVCSGIDPVLSERVDTPMRWFEALRTCCIFVTVTHRELLLKNAFCCPTPSVHLSVTSVVLGSSPPIQSVLVVAPPRGYCGCST